MEKSKILELFNVFKLLNSFKIDLKGLLTEEVGCKNEGMSIEVKPKILSELR